MIHVVALLVVGALLGGLTWRLSGGRGAAIPAWVALPWTLWLAEAALTAVAPAPAPAVDPAAGKLGLVTERWHGGVVNVDTVRPGDDRPRVVLVGDSFVAGKGVVTEDTLSVLLHDALAPHVDVDVRNLGEPGVSFFDGAVRYAALGGAIDPDVVVWVFVLNDFGTGGLQEGFDFVDAGQPPARTGSALVDTVRRALWSRRVTAETEHAYRVALAEGVPQLAAAQALLRQVADELHGRGGRLVFAVYPMLHALDAYPFDAEHDRLDAMARAAGAEVVDLRPALRGQDASRLWASVQDHHPNRAANELVTAVLVDALRAGTLQRTGELSCDALGSYPGVESAVRAACAGGPREQLDLVDTLAQLQLAEGYTPVFMPTLRWTFTARAGWLAERDGDAASVERAKAGLAAGY